MTAASPVAALAQLPAASLIATAGPVTASAHSHIVAIVSSHAFVPIISAGASSSAQSSTTQAMATSTKPASLPPALRVTTSVNALTCSACGSSPGFLPFGERKSCAMAPAQA